MIILATFKLPTTGTTPTYTTSTLTDTTASAHTTSNKQHNNGCLSSNSVYNFHFIRLKDNSNINNIHSNNNIYQTSSSSSISSGGGKSSSGIILNSNNIKEYHVSTYSTQLIVIRILRI